MYLPVSFTQVSSQHVSSQCVCYKLRNHNKQHCDKKKKKKERKKLKVPEEKPNLFIIGYYSESSASL